MEKLWICFTKVVVFFTRNPTKLDLHFYVFFTIFYEIYKNQQNNITIQDSNFQPGPWKFSQTHTYALALHLRPQKEAKLCNWVLGPRGGVAGRNSGEPAMFSTGEGVEEG
jgi:hypothetical protein